MLIYIGRYDDVANVSYQQNFTDISILLALFTHKAATMHCVIALHDGMSRNPSCYFISD